MIEHQTFNIVQILTTKVLFPPVDHTQKDNYHNKAQRRLGQFPIAFQLDTEKFRSLF